MAYELKTVLAATDFSRAAEAALHRAAAMAQARGARLEILHVTPHSLAGDAWQLLADYWRSRLSEIGPEHVREIVSARLREAAARVAAETGPPPDIQLAEGRPPTEIAARAATLGADLIAVGAHGEHALRQLFVGSTAQKLLHLAPCPVLMVRQWPLGPYGRVLLPTDFSEPSRQAARLARDLFADTPPCLLHAYELPYEGMLRYASAQESLIERYHREAQARLYDELAAFAKWSGFSPNAALLRVEHGHAPARIVDVAHDVGADLIVIGTRGRSGLEAAFLGSVALHVALEARCDVLFVRPPVTR